MSDWKVEFYQDIKGNRPVEDFMETLPASKKARALRLIEVLKDFGIKLGKPYVKHIDGKLWEFRPGSERVFYFLYTGRKFVLVHAITKKSKKTPKQAIKISKKRMQDYEQRSKN